MSEPRPARPRCANCDAALSGPYCSRCGQADRNPAEIGLGQLLREWAGDVLTFDSRILRTLRPLVRRPGFLTAEYFAGRRARYVPPLRLFIFLSLVMLLTMSLTGVRWNWSVSQDGRQVAAHTGAVRDSESDAAETVGEDAEDPEVAAEPADPSVIERANRRLIERLPQALLLLAPVMGFWVWLLHRRRYPHYVPHLIFALHVYSFWFLVMSLAGLLDLAWPNGLAGSALILATWPAYLFLAQRHVYGGGWWSNLARTAFIASAQTLAFFALMILLITAIVLLG